MCSWKKLKTWYGIFNFALKNRILQHHHLRSVKKYFSLFYLFPSEYVITYTQYFFDVVRNQTSNKKHLLQLIKRRSRCHQKNMSHECDLIFVLWKIFFMDFSKPIGVSLWIVYKLPENNCCLPLLTKFIQTILKYSNWKITCHSVLKLSLVTKLLTILSLVKYIIPSTVALTVSMIDYGGMHFLYFLAKQLRNYLIYWTVWFALDLFRESRRC